MLINGVHVYLVGDGGEAKQEYTPPQQSSMNDNSGDVTEKLVCADDYEAFKIVTRLTDKFDAKDATALSVRVQFGGEGPWCKRLRKITDIRRHGIEIKEVPVASSGGYEFCQPAFGKLELDEDQEPDQTQVDREVESSGLVTVTVHRGHSIVPDPTKKRERRSQRSVATGAEGERKQRTTSRDVIKDHGVTHSIILSPVPGARVPASTGPATPARPVFKAVSHELVGVYQFRARSLASLMSHGGLTEQQSDNLWNKRKAVEEAKENAVVKAPRLDEKAETKDAAVP